jgi:NAD(P)-dependent dehydrogenase (short-subunit alcohol dehydrogenase family)
LCAPVPPHAAPAVVGCRRYYCSRVFVPLLRRAPPGEECALVNTSSVNGFWASLGPGSAHSAYSAAKFAVRARHQCM